MRIAVDAMGGDFAPKEIVRGAVDAAKKYDCEIVLIGDEEKIRTELQGENIEALGISIVHAAEVIRMNEHPAEAVRSKKDSSIVVATHLVKEGNCDAVLSAGSTGAAVTAAQLILHRIRGVGRPEGERAGEGNVSTPEGGAEYSLYRECGRQGRT